MAIWLDVLEFDFLGNSGLSGLDPHNVNHLQKGQQVIAW